MKCVGCPDFVDDICQKAQLGKICEVEEITCLLKMLISVSRGIHEQLEDLNANWNNGDNWKQNGS